MFWYSVRPLGEKNFWCKLCFVILIIMMITLLSCSDNLYKSTVEEMNKYLLLLSFQNEIMMGVVDSNPVISIYHPCFFGRLWVSYTAC